MSVTEQQGFLRENCFININRGIEGIFQRGAEIAVQDQKNES